MLVDSEARTGLDVVVPGPEYEDLEALADDAAFTDVDVFRAQNAGTSYLLVVEKDPDSELAVFVPAYYDHASGAEKIESIRSAGELHLFCRRLNNDYVEFVHGDVEPFFPDGPQTA